MAEPAKFELYTAPIDGQRCLRVEGRLRRLKLPLPAEPPHDVPPAACFLCRPERDRFDLGAWPDEHGALRVIGNAHAFADRALLLAPFRPSRESSESRELNELHELHELHEATPATLPIDLLAELLRAPFDPSFRRAHGLVDLDLVAFVNVGVRAAQSRRHPHVQVVGFEPSRRAVGSGDPREVAADLASAQDEGRVVELGANANPNHGEQEATRTTQRADTRRARVVVPRAPGMTAEVWLALPNETEEARSNASSKSVGTSSSNDPTRPSSPWLDAARSVQAACIACERGLSGSYNLVLRLAEPRLIRLVPRGLSERAGLELAAPSVVGSVIAASVRETILLWQTAAAV